MIVVDYGVEHVIRFYCDKCDFNGEYDVSNLITDNCALDIDVICEMCGDCYVLYVLKCVDPAQAKELNARLEFLKYKRSAEDSGDDDKNFGERRTGSNT